VLLFTLVLLSQILSVDAEKLEGVDGQKHIANIRLLVSLNVLIKLNLRKKNIFSRIEKVMHT